jgi:hypothetical protein
VHGAELSREKRPKVNKSVDFPRGESL